MYVDEREVKKALDWLKMAVWYWECNLPANAGPTEIDDLNSAKRYLSKSTKDGPFPVGEQSTVQ